MKHFVTFVVILSIAALACSPAASTVSGKDYLPTVAPTAVEYTVTAEFLNVRQFPDAGAAVVETLEAGAVVECLQTVKGVYGGVWCNVGDGWVDMAWLRIVDKINQNFIQRDAV